MTLSKEKRINAALDALSDDEKIRLSYDWYNIFARDKQKPPIGDWAIWFILAGRGFGKTRTGAEWVRSRVESGEAKRIAFVAPTAADARDVMVEGDSGILNVSPHWNKPLYEPSKRRLTWPNGVTATLYSAEEPARLNGPQHDTAWCDEIGVWKYGRETWDMLQFGVRLGEPRQIVTSTPKVQNISLLKEILKQKGTVSVTGSTYENRDNLSEIFFETVIARYEGTRLGRQELNAELLEDVPGALWTRTLIDDLRRGVPGKEDIPEMRRIVIGVDPQGKKDDKERTMEEGPRRTGIVAAGLGVDGHGYVLEDATINGLPIEWGNRSIATYETWKGNRVVAEDNYGGEMVKYVIHSIDDTVPYKPVHASRGKTLRAEPISALYEQGKVHHVGFFSDLEDEMCSYTYESKFSPNRLDALVWALTELMIGGTGDWARTFQTKMRE